MTIKHKGEAFVKLPRDLLESAAWRSLSINARRFLDFLMIEHMRQGGRHNGFLQAPRRQLEASGIGAHFVSGAIDEVERLGLVDCRRGIGRRPSVYALTWLPLSDGSEPSNRWRSYAIMTAKQQSLLMTAVSTKNDCQTAVTKPVVSAKQQSQSPKSSTAKQQHPSRRSYHGKAEQGVGAEPNRASVVTLPATVRRTGDYAQPEAIDDQPVRFVDGDS